MLVTVAFWPGLVRVLADAVAVTVTMDVSKAVLPGSVSVSVAVSKTVEGASVKVIVRV